MMNPTKRGFLILTALVITITILSYVLPYVVLPKLGVAIKPPAVSLAAEVLRPNVLPGIHLTNGTTSMIIVFGVVIAILLYINHYVSKQSPDQYIPGNTFLTLIDAIVEFWDGQAGELPIKFKLWILPLTLTIFLFFGFANIIKMMPGTETVGLAECVRPNQIGYPLHFGFLDTNRGDTATQEEYEMCEKTHSGLFMVVPFLKPLATDINAPLALALITIVTVQIWGVMALGIAYFFKFINLPAVGDGKIMDAIIGAIETISEVTKPLSLSLRMMFALFVGGVLLMVVSFLLGAAGAFVFYVLELVVGLFQAFIFAMLTLVYGSQAIAHHSD